MDPDATLPQPAVTPALIGLPDGKVLAVAGPPPDTEIRPGCREAAWYLLAKVRIIKRAGHADRISDETLAMREDLPARHTAVETVRETLTLLADARERPRAPWRPPPDWDNQKASLPWYRPEAGDDGSLAFAGLARPPAPPPPALPPALPAARPADPPWLAAIRRGLGRGG